MENNLNAQINGKEHKKIRIEVVIITTLLVLLIGVLGYVFYDRVLNNNTPNTNNGSNTTDNSSTNNNGGSTNITEVTQAIIDEAKTKVGDKFFWIKDNQLTDMNQLDNDLKICLAISLTPSINPSLNFYTEAQVLAGLKSVIANGTMVYGDLTGYYGMDCATALSLKYSQTKHGYDVIGTGFEGNQPLTVSVIEKSDFDGTYYNLYFRTIHMDAKGKVFTDNTFTKNIATFELYTNDFDIEVVKTTSTEGKTLDSYVSQGTLHKLSFVMQNNELKWAKYAKVTE